MADSPITPAKIATAFNKICTTVIKLPGLSCMAKTSRARTSPSLAKICNLIFRAEAKASSELDTIALIAISKKIEITALIKVMIVNSQLFILKN